MGEAKFGQEVEGVPPQAAILRDLAQALAQRAVGGEEESLPDDGPRLVHAGSLKVTRRPKLCESPSGCRAFVMAPPSLRDCREAFCRP